ncbi:MAG: hypothetical protein P8M22_07615 [Phycisphaerales bacterium]|nr:hypothetical protein [Phycisphaerales bacterium]
MPAFKWTTASAKISKAGSLNSESWNQDVPDGGILESGFQADGGLLSPTNVLVNGIPAEESP